MDRGDGVGFGEIVPSQVRLGDRDISKSGDGGQPDVYGLCRREVDLLSERVFELTRLALVLPPVGKYEAAEGEQRANDHAPERAGYLASEVDEGLPPRHGGELSGERLGLAGGSDLGHSAGYI